MPSKPGSIHNVNNLGKKKSWDKVEEDKEKFGRNVQYNYFAN